MKRIAKSMIVLALLYVALLFWGDFRRQVFADFDRLLHVMPVLIGLTIVSVVIRFLRWRMLLQHAGVRISSVSYDFLAYIAGFAFTATPGKVGELFRIRYYGPMGVPSSKVISAFVFERAFDLIAVLILSCFAVTRLDLIIISIAFVVVFIAVILTMMFHSSILASIADYLRKYEYEKLAALCMTLHTSLVECRIWMNFQDILMSLLLGILAWAAAAYSVVFLLNDFGIDVPVVQAMTVFPLATLVGAASMLPGGVGSTEVVLTMLLTYYGVAVPVAAFMTVGIRIGSLWFSILSGLIALIYLEYIQNHKKNPLGPFSKNME